MKSNWAKTLPPATCVLMNRYIYSDLSLESILILQFQMLQVLCVLDGKEWENICEHVIITIIVSTVTKRCLI